MKVLPKKGLVLVSQHQVPEKKKGGLLLPGTAKKKTYMKVESQGELYQIGDCVIAPSHKIKMEVEDNLFLIEEIELLATVEIQDDN